MRHVCLLLLASCGSTGSSDDAGTDATVSDVVGMDVPSSGDSGNPDGSSPSTVVIAAAGDISESSIGNQKKTSDLVLAGKYDAVLLLGDNQYPDGTASTFLQYFDPTWGRFKSLIRPAPGNHDYHTTGASGYFGYFGVSAGDPTKGYYSYDLGAWHLIALNTNDNSCGFVGCNASSAQVAWLKADLAQNKQKCTLAYWHHPRFNSGSTHGNFTGAQAFWDALYVGGADIVLNGHEHVYERFDPQNPMAGADPQNGIRQFTVGTGGAGFYSFGTPQPNSAMRENGSFGVIKLTLKPDSYDWDFLAVAPSTFMDKGTGQCH